MTPSTSTTAVQRDNAIGRLEKLVLAKPGHLPTLKALVMLLEAHQPGALVSGRYTDCQRALSGATRHEGWLEGLSTPEEIVEGYSSWQGLLDSKSLPGKLPITQSFAGRFHVIKGEGAACGQRMEMFAKEGVISRLCHDCYKVQILPLDLTGLMQTYFILRRLKLPKDNARKCMIELREDVVNPYKGYIYCEAEDEAKNCLAAFREALDKLAISNILCGFSHGCSEYGLKYPEFKYSADGAHRRFDRPADWDRVETGFWDGVKKPVRIREDNNHDGLSLRDVMAFRTWIDYAEIIGDESWRLFRDRPNEKKTPRFAERTRKQAKQRHAEMQELRKRLSSAA